MTINLVKFSAKAAAKAAEAEAQRAGKPTNQPAGGTRRRREPSESDRPVRNQRQNTSEAYRIPRRERDSGAEAVRQRIVPVDENPGSTWALALAFWPLEDRPEAMTDPAVVNSMPLATIFQFKEHFEAQAKREGKGEASFGRDRTIPTKFFQAEEDNCADRLHAARFERGPVVEVPDYWDLVPLKRTHTYRHLPLEHAGAANDINERTITRAHDRTMPLRIRMFMAGNSSKKSFHSTESEGKEPADSWEPPR